MSYDPSTMIGGDIDAPIFPDAIDQASTLQWARVRGALKGDVGDNVYRSWIKPLVLVGHERGHVQIGAPSRFARDWVEENYGDQLRALWAEQDPNLTRVEIIVQVPLTSVPEGATGRMAPPISAPRPASDAVSVPIPTDARLGAASLDSFSADLDPRFTFANFVVGKENELAHAAARRVAEAESVPFNPLFLYGSVGLGKTHLMHAIAHHIKERTPNRRVLYLSAEKFMYQFIRALRHKNTVAFKEMFRSVDVLMIDDVQFIGGKDSTQEEFFHTFNALVDQNRQVVISADKSPSELEGVHDRLRSRLGWGLVADIHPTSYELRLSILHAKRDQHPNVQIPAAVLEFLAHRITSSVRELEGALNRIVAHAELVGRKVTLESTSELLRDLVRASDRRVTIDEIQRKTAEHFGIKLAEMHSARRARSVARPRQVAMYLAKQLTSRSLPEIGRKFGGRDHTTVIHAVKKIEELCNADPAFHEDVELLRRMLTT